MTTTDIIAEAKKRLAEVQAEAAQLRRMIDAAEGTERPRVDIGGGSITSITGVSITGSGFGSG